MGIYCLKFFKDFLKIGELIKIKIDIKVEINIYKVVNYNYFIDFIKCI